MKLGWTASFLRNKRSFSRILASFTPTQQSFQPNKWLTMAGLLIYVCSCEGEFPVPPWIFLCVNSIFPITVLIEIQGCSRSCRQSCNPLVCIVLAARRGLSTQCSCSLTDHPSEAPASTFLEGMLSVQNKQDFSLVYKRLCVFKLPVTIFQMIPFF